MSLPVPAGPAGPDETILMALTQRDVAFLLDKTSAQDMRTADLALKLAGALLEFASYAAQRTAAMHTAPPQGPTGGQGDGGAHTAQQPYQKHA